MYRAVPSKNKKICHQNDRNQNIVQKSAGYIIKISAQVWYKVQQPYLWSQWNIPECSYMYWVIIPTNWLCNVHSLIYISLSTIISFHIILSPHILLFLQQLLQFRNFNNMEKLHIRLYLGCDHAEAGGILWRMPTAITIAEEAYTILVVHVWFVVLITQWFSYL